MSEEAILKQLNEFVATVELSVNDWNVLVNVLNVPQQAQTIILARLIDVLQNQIGPQVAKAREALEAVKNADGVPKDLEEKN
ncbi:hypothetical protein UFOVP230_16 [uncultured Caudovirales phage]|uniref:Uncharacterized protein n=1 Tax=uncultured Caudovirales phage TaxID=2100421 RepID=A0A6J7XSK6_9CAUD|nr:hypothetical protein UFOVP230_16 [uncultured Caudovirales phage]